MNGQNLEEQRHDPLSLARSLVELMREESDLSWSHSQLCVEAVVSRIHHAIRNPSLEPLLEKLNQVSPR